MKNGYQPKTKNPNPDYRPPIGGSNVQPAQSAKNTDNTGDILLEVLTKALVAVFTSIYGEDESEVTSDDH